LNRDALTVCHRHFDAATPHCETELETNAVSPSTMVPKIGSTGRSTLNWTKLPLCDLTPNIAISRESSAISADFSPDVRRAVTRVWQQPIAAT
jgi:hypothetical protein